MKRILVLSFLCSLSLRGAQLDSAAVGRDLNGWNEERVAWFGTDGLSFRSSMPEARYLEDGSMEVVMVVEEVRNHTAVYVANIIMVVSGDGLVQSVAVTGKVDGARFNSGVVSRSESTEDEALDSGPENPEEEMQQELSQSLDSSIEHARTKGRVRRDVAARWFGDHAGGASSLAKATGIAVESLFRRVGPGGPPASFTK